MIQAKKFYATLPHKIDRAVESYHKQTSTPEESPEIIEEGVFGTDGWSIRKTHPTNK